MTTNPRPDLNRCTADNPYLMAYRQWNRIAMRMHDSHGTLPMPTLLMIDRFQQLIRIEAELKGFDVTCAWEEAA